jgi:hypothetical protein
MNNDTRPNLDLRGYYARKRAAFHILSPRK